MKVFKVYTKANKLGCDNELKQELETREDLYLTGGKLVDYDYDFYVFTISPDNIQSIYTFMAGISKHLLEVAEKSVVVFLRDGKYTSFRDVELEGFKQILLIERRCVNTFVCETFDEAIKWLYDKMDKIKLSEEVGETSKTSALSALDVIMGKQNNLK